MQGCDFDKSSLRGHLARTTKGCKNMFTSDELKTMEDQAKVFHKDKIAVWKKEHSQKSEVGDTQELSTRPSVATPQACTQQAPPIAFEGKCRGCDFNGKSVRGHLAKTT